MRESRATGGGGSSSVASFGGIQVGISDTAVSGIHNMLSGWHNVQRDKLWKAAGTPEFTKMKDCMFC